MRRTTIQNLVRTEDGWAVVLDQSILDSLGILPDALLQLVVDERELVITPYVDPERAKKFDEILEKTNRRFGPALCKLAE